MRTGSPNPLRTSAKNANRSRSPLRPKIFSLLVPQPRMTSSRCSFRLFSVLLLAALLAPLSSHAANAPTSNPFLGRWALTIPDGRAGWLEIKQERGWYDGSLLWGSGSVLPVANVVIAD